MRISHSGQGFWKKCLPLVDILSTGIYSPFGLYQNWGLTGLFPGIKIDGRSEVPIYRQISEQIAAMIRSGRLRPGEHLPPERELALRLHIARGTVKKAYESLVNRRYIVAARGKGSMVTPELAPGEDNDAVFSPGLTEAGIAENKVDSGASVSTAVAVRAIDAEKPAGRIDVAGRVLGDAIISLEELGFSFGQIKDLFVLKLEQRREQVAAVSIAAVDCNPESLGIYQKQLAVLTHKSPAQILLSVLREAGSAETVLAPFDLILTTSNHVEELQQLAPSVAHKIVGVIVSPIQETLIALARLGNGSRAGVLHQSERFFSIIRGWLQKSGFQGEIRGFNISTGSDDDLAGFVADRSVLIVPPGFVAQLQSGQLKSINRFRLDGGQVIDFEYQIERGSLLHLEELIRRLLKTRK